MPGNVVAQSNMQRELGIVAGARDELAKAAIRKAGAGIPGNRMDDVGFTALDEYFGDDFADCSPKRDGVKMALALGAGVDHKIGVAKRRRLAENRRRHGHGFIEGKSSNQRRRSVRDRCDVAGQLDPGFQLNHGNKRFEYLVKQLDLFLRMTARSGDEQVGDACKRP
jgi:hypothetical protein